MMYDTRRGFAQEISHASWQMIDLRQESQTHLGVRATLQDISPSAGHAVFRDDKMQ